MFILEHEQMIRSLFINDIYLEVGIFFLEIFQSNVVFGIVWYPFGPELPP